MERRGMKRAEVDKMIEGLQSDTDAEYAEVIELDAARSRRWCHSGRSGEREIHPRTRRAGAD